MSQIDSDSIPKTAIVVFNRGAFGGAPKRMFNLFLHLNRLYTGKFYFFVNTLLNEQIKEVYQNIPEEYIRVIDLGKRYEYKPEILNSGGPRFYKVAYSDPVEEDERHTIFRKIYWFYRNKRSQYRIFRKIEKLRSELDIKAFYAVFSGVLPLVFYLNEKPRRVSVIFSDMDSWFAEVHSDMKKLWYRKYYSFNHALENADAVDFLSPYIFEGVKKLGVKMNESSVHISPCSFADYSHCSVGEKRSVGFQVAFCGRLEPDKNPMLYLEAAGEILKKYPDVKFHILGEGTLVRNIKEYIDSRDLSLAVNFQFHKNPPEVFKKTSVFVSLQSNTNYPSQSVLEAMACGNAVIASNRGDTNLLINETDGMLVGLNKDDLVAALVKLIMDPQLAKSLGENGRNAVLKNHTIEKFTEYFIGLIGKANEKTLRMI